MESIRASILLPQAKNTYMKPNLRRRLIWPLIIAWPINTRPISNLSDDNKGHSMDAITLPPEFKRIKEDERSFGCRPGKLTLKKTNAFSSASDN